MELDKAFYVKVKEGELYCKQSGKGEHPILWVHGLPLSSEAWYPQLNYFDSKAQNTVFDLRGYGCSSKLPDSYSSVTDLYMDDFQTIITECKLKQPTLVGFASAGHAVLRFAALYPELISKLIVINGSPCFLSREDWQGGFNQTALNKAVKMIEKTDNDEDIYLALLNAAMNEQGGTELARLKTWYLQLAKSSGRKTIKAFFENIAYDDDRALMSKISAPTLLISSRLGKEVPSSTALFLRQQIKNSQLFELNDIDHFAYATKSGLINQTIEQFIFPHCEIDLPTDVDFNKDER